MKKRGWPGPTKLCVHMCSVVSNSSWPDELLQPTRLLCPWDSPRKNIEEGCHALLRGIFPTQWSNPCLLRLLHWQVNSLSTEPSGYSRAELSDSRVGKRSIAGALSCSCHCWKFSSTLSTFFGYFCLGTRGHCLKSGSFLYLVCGWERLLSLRTSLRLVPCQKPLTYYKSFLSPLSTTSVIMIPFHVHLFRYATLLPAFGNPPGRGCFC